MLVKTITLNLAMVFVLLCVVGCLTLVDRTLGIPSFQSVSYSLVGFGLIGIGIFFRLWASYTFYSNGVKVLATRPQDIFTRAGIYAYSRNPLYVGIVSLVFGFALVFGSWSGIGVSILLFLAWRQYLIYIDEPRLLRQFGNTYQQYLHEVSRWIGKLS